MTIAFPPALRRPRAFWISLCNVVGLAFSLAGLLLLFYFALPNKVPGAPGNLLLEEASPGWEKRQQRYDTYAHLGLVLAVLGTIMEAVPPVCTAIGSARRRRNPRALGVKMPEGSWPPYRVGNSDYIHALGVIASVFNLLEFRFRSLFPIYTRLPSNPAYILFGKITNEMRLELILGAIDFSTHPDPIKDHVRHFLAGFKRCADNRNILMHSTVMFVFGPGDIPCPELSPPDQQPQGLAFQKSPKGDPFQINTYQLTIEEIRAQADAMKSFEIYGDRLFWHIVKNYEPTRYQSFGLPEEAQFALPNRPILPNLLHPISPDTKKE